MGWIVLVRCIGLGYIVCVGLGWDTLTTLSYSICGDNSVQKEKKTFHTANVSSVYNNCILPVKISVQ